ncbi:MAG: rod shape-determining protein MreC [Syntrophales bacterium]|jgi:rod shape-determining protein MreC|nr:rod shape-determining protein MreC [Syntrophales bacterium]
MLIPKKYRSHITAAVFLIISLAIISYGASSLTEPGFLRKTVMEIATPFANLVNLSSKGLSDFWRRYLFLVGLEEDNRRLRAEKAALAEQLNNYREGYYEGLRLRKLLDLQRGLPYRTVTARVVDNNQNSLSKTILIDKGTADGLSAGYPVLSAQGVTGRIMETSWHSSRVLLMIDGTSNIDAIIQRSRTQGILQGTGKSGYKLKYIPPTADVLPGDLLLSSGMAGVFPKGLIIGIVSKIEPQKNELFQKIDVSPSVDFSRLEEVLILLPGKEPGP